MPSPGVSNSHFHNFYPTRCPGEAVQAENITLTGAYCFITIRGTVSAKLTSPGRPSSRPLRIRAHSILRNALGRQSSLKTPRRLNLTPLFKAICTEFFPKSFPEWDPTPFPSEISERVLKNVKMLDAFAEIDAPNTFPEDVRLSKEHSKVLRLSMQERVPLEVSSGFFFSQ